jgi:hypothetical protein
MPNEQTMTITETAPDGTETKIEITTTKAGDAVDGDDPSLAEVIEALFDPDGDFDDDADTTGTDGDTSQQSDPAMHEMTPTPEELSTNSSEFNIGRDSFPSIDIPPGTIDPLPTDSGNTGFTPATSGTEATPIDTGDTGFAPPASIPDPATTEPAAPAADPGAAELQAHADAAKEAQDAADQFVAEGDYKAASEARETAENESWQAGDNSMLSGSNAGELSNAGDRQDAAAEYREQQTYDVEHGNYEAAKEDAQNVAYATGDADYQAGGADHSGQADKDVGNLDWAVWDEKNADYQASNAQAYAAEGEFDIAGEYAGRADSYQANADDYAGHADPGGAAYSYDPSSEVASGGTYDAGVEAPAYDAGAIDTGFDAAASAAPAYEPTTDDV